MDSLRRHWSQKPSRWWRVCHSDPSGQKLYHGYFLLQKAITSCDYYFPFLMNSNCWNHKEVIVKKKGFNFLSSKEQKTFFFLCKVVYRNYNFNERCERSTHINLYMLYFTGGLFFWGVTNTSRESTMYPKAVQDLCGWKIRSLACGWVLSSLVSFFSFGFYYPSAIKAWLSIVGTPPGGWTAWTVCWCDNSRTSSRRFIP